jgi:antitoxin HicB
MTPDRYSRSVAWSSEDSCFVALCPEFPDLSGVGETRAEAEAALDEALAVAIELAHEESWTLPEPHTISEFSGQFRVRLPRSLHARLSRRAELEDVSLNTLVATMLGEQLGSLNTYARMEEALCAVRDQARSAVLALQSAAWSRSATAAYQLSTSADVRPSALARHTSGVSLALNTINN